MNDLISTMFDTNKKFHWKQRLALTRHNLHTASLTQDFSFFKTLQALNLVSGTNHLSILTSALAAASTGSDEDKEDLADSLILTLDKFNTIVACVHEDAFKSVFDSARVCAGHGQTTPMEKKVLYYASMAAERRQAEEAIDKMFNSAVDAISGQPESAQDSAAWVFILGTTFIADAIGICLLHMDKIGDSLDDPFRLESNWSTVQSAVATATSGMKGVFKLMDQSEPDLSRVSPRDLTPDATEGHAHQRAQSADGYAKTMFRRMSTAFTTGPALHASSGSNSASSSTSTLPSRKSSVSSFISAPSRKSSVVSNSNSNSSSASGHRGVGAASMNGFAAHMPSKSAVGHSGLTKTMSPIPSTPSAEGVTAKANPFDATFANNVAFNRYVPSLTADNSTSFPEHRASSPVRPALRRLDSPPSPGSPNSKRVRWHNRIAALQEEYPGMAEQSSSAPEFRLKLMHIKAA